MGGMRRPKKWVVALVVIGGTLVGVGLLVGFWTGIGPYDLPPKSRQLEDVIAVSKSLGLPMTQEELVPEAPPKDTNAAPDVVGLMREMRGKSPDPRSLLNRGVSSARTEAIAAIEEQSDRLDKISSLIAARPEWHVQRDYDLGVALLYPEYADTKNAVRLFSCRAMMRAQQGDAERSFQDIRAARSLARKSSDEPSLIALLVAIACESIALRTIEVASDALVGSPTALQKLEEAIQETNKSLDVTQAFRGEFYTGLTITRNFRVFGGFDFFTELVDQGQDAPPVDTSKLQRSGLPEEMFERASLTVFAQAWNDLFSAFQAMEQPYRGWGKIIDKHTERMESRFRASELLPRILLPVYSTADFALSQHDVLQDLAVAFIRCMRYRAEHKRWPTSLKEINADFPDTFAPGKTIQAKFGPNELRVWSVGRNRVDDGGKIRVKGEDGEDTVFVWPPSLRPVPR